MLCVRTILDAGDMSKEVTFRIAGPEDYGRAVGIHGNVYDGADYLPTLYHHIIKDQDTIICVAETEGKLVCMTAITSALDGRAALGFMSRTSPAYQHRGISTRLKAYKRKVFLERHPKVEMFLYVAPDSEFQAKRYMYDKNYIVLERTNFIKLEVSLETLCKEFSSLNLTNTSVCVEKLTPELLVALDTTGVFPGKYILTFRGTSLPVRACKYKLLDSLTVYEGTVTTYGFFTRESTPSDTTKSDKVQALSLNHTFRVRKGVNCVYYFYGTPELFEVHFSTQMSMLKDQNGPQNPVILNIHFPETIPTEGIQQFLQNLTKKDVKLHKYIIVRENIKQGSLSKL